MQDTTPVTSSLGQYVHMTRVSKNLRLVDVRNRGGPSVSLLSELETGSLPGAPKLSTLRKIAKALDEPEADIFRAAGLLPLVAAEVSMHQPTPEELAVMARASSAGLAFPEGWLGRVPQGERRRLMRDLELMAEEIERLRRVYP